MRLYNVDDMLEILQAYKDGKKIEYNHNVGDDHEDEWYPVTTPVFNFGTTDYRITDEAIPYTSVEQVDKDFKEHGPMVLSTDSNYKPTRFALTFYNNDNIFIGTRECISLEQALKEYTWQDGHPFGIIED